MDIIGYTFKAENFCPKHIIEALISAGVASPGAREMAAETVLDQIAGANAIDRNDLYSFDSDDFPKPIYSLDSDLECTPCALATPARTLQDVATEYPDDPGTVEASDVSGLEEYISGATVFPADVDGTCTVYLHVQESLQWHADREQSIRADARQAYRDEHPPVFERESDDDDWTLTEPAFAAIPGIISERYEGENFDMAGDVIAFDISLNLPSGTPVSALGGLFWEQSKIVRFMNETDPGTFGSPYLFGTVIQDAMKAGQ